MKEATTIINEIEKRFKKVKAHNLFLDVMDLRIYGDFGIDNAEKILEEVKLYFDSKGYSTTYTNAFFSTWMHGEITIKRV